MQTTPGAALLTTVRPWNGAPALFINDEPHTGLMLWHTKPGVGKPEISLFAEQGVHLVSTGFSAPACWREDGTYDFSAVDRTMELVLAGNAQALVLPRVHLAPPRWWAERHPEDMQWDTTAGRERRRWAAFSSARWRECLEEILPAFVRYAEARYGDRFFGYHVGDGDCGEWSYSWAATRGDFSPAQVAAFRAWLGGRYGNDEALQRAWADPAVTLDTAAIPVPAPPVWPHPWPRPWTIHRPETQRAHIDYLTFHSEVAAEAALRSCRLVKATLGELGRTKVCGVFYGYHFWELGMPYLHISGHQALDAVLASPDVDFLCAPETYQERQPGRMFLSQLPAASLRLHGKLFYNEEDTYTHLAQVQKHRYCCPDAATTSQILRRNLLGTLREGGTQWWMDLDGEHWYMDTAVMQEVGRLRAFAEQALRGDRRSCAQIAVIVSAESQPYLRYDPAFVDAALGRQISELTSLGAPMDIYGAGDLDALFSSAAGDQYRLVVFLDALYLSAAQRRVIKTKVARGGRTLFWQFACGLIDDSGVSADAMTDVIGIRVGLEDHAGPLLAETFVTGDRLTYGTDRDMGPHLFGQDPQAQVLGWLLHRGTPALLVKTLADSRAVWSAAPALPVPVLRLIARQAGVHLYTDQGDQVFAARDWLGLHAATSGSRTVRLPSPATVRDAFSGEELARRADEFSVTVARGETHLWTLCVDS